MITEQDLINSGFISAKNYAMLKSAINDGSSILIVGYYGAGKSTLASALINSLNNDNIITDLEKESIDSVLFSNTMMKLANTFNLGIIDELYKKDMMTLCRIPKDGFRCISCMYENSAGEAIASLLGFRDCTKDKILGLFDYIVTCKRYVDGTRGVSAIDKVNQDYIDYGLGALINVYTSRRLVSWKCDI